MNYQNLKTLIKAKFAKNLTAFIVLTLSVFLIFFSKTSVPQSLPDCATAVGALQPGNNCLFYGLPLCNNVPGAGYNIPGSSITSQAPNPRINCANLSDLPLCTQIDVTATPIKNCVKECSDASFDRYAGVRGQDYAIHNRDCIRFCDAPEVGVIADSSINCTARKCHQLGSDITPNPTVAPTNCEIFKCNLLTPDELNEVKMDDSAKKYCEGSNLKCYDFTIAQLTYTKLRAINSMCETHDCRTDSEECVPYQYRKFRCDEATHTILNPSCDLDSTCDALGYCTKRDPDNVQKILNKGSSYIAAYQNYINFGYDIQAKTICKLIICRPVVYREYRCSPFADIDPITLNVSCDPTTINPIGGATVAATCSGGYCTKKLDCNKPENNNEPECSNSNLGTSSGSVDDTGIDSWFYRPKPDSGAVTNSGILKTMDSICYTKGQMLSHGWGEDPEIDFGLFTIPLGYFHWDNRSPEMCGTPRVGHRGNGYIYLCGADGLLYRKAKPYTAYHKGYVKTDYVEGDATHKINICVRYNNTMNVRRSCGSRECMIVCAFGICTQQCGSDICRELTLTDSHPDDCAMEKGGSGDCSSTLETYVRMRAIKYKDYICTFLDMKGTLAYDPQYYNGTEKMADGTCFSGTNVDGACAGAQNTNDDEGSASVWRTLFQIPYVQNNRPAGQPRGYLNLAGRLFKEHECIKVPYRIHIPKTYNIANLTNSPNLFTPPLYVLNSRLQRGALISVGTAQDPLGPTDFNYPELEVRFGITTQKLSLGIGKTGYETGGNVDNQGSANISTVINGFTYEVEIFVRKEEFPNSGLPIFCLYRKIKDSSGVYLDPLRVKCINRFFPEVNNIATKIITPAIDLRRVIISTGLGNSYSSSSIVLRYLSGTTLSSINCSSAGASCTAELPLSNLDPAIPTCDVTLERHEVCAQREECSKLNVECMQNEVDIYAALNAAQPIDSFLTVRQNCNEILLPLCNSKKGLVTEPSSTIIGSNPNRSPTDVKIYGWFNELCFSSGFEKRLKTIVAHDLRDDLKGKCVINVSSPYLTDSDASTNCNDGGKAPNCLCVEAIQDVDLGPGYEARTQTPREAGLCIDIPIPQTCQAIDYNLTVSPSNDSEFIASSINNNVYGTSTSDISGKVHISHRYRSEGKPTPNAILLKGHAEFPVSVIGTVNVNGECKGFWTYQRSVGGTMQRPLLNCINTSGTAAWEADARNACTRYQCSQVFTAGPAINGFYQGNYGLLETAEDKGLSHGFAIWPSYLKTDDFTETVNATACITGFKKLGAITTTLAGTVSGSNAVTASLYNLITSYSGGTSASRQCNQMGQWLPPINLCQRISCPAVNPPIPSGSADNTAWELWRNSGGATFPAVNASRSTSNIQTESISTGICNNSLGYFRSTGGLPPTRECNYLGNLSEVINPCSTACTAITEGGAGGVGGAGGTANNFNNGFAKWGIIKKEVILYEHCNYGGWAVAVELGDYPSNPWGQASSFRINGSSVKIILYSGANFTGLSETLTGDHECFVYIGLNDAIGSFKIQTASGNSLVGEFQGCVAGYVTNPYSSRFNIDGTPLSDAVANDLTRPAQNPQRLCQITNNTGFTSSVWGGVVNGCINQCPGSDEDPRVGVGVTSHPTSSGTTLVNWPATPFGQDAYVSNHGNEAVLGASFFLQNRANGFYLLRRHCGIDGKWTAPDVMCSANNGQINNSVYLLPAVTGFKNSIVAGGGTVVTGACASNSYWKYNYDQDPFPQMSCNFDATNKIDKVYLTLTGGTHDCEQRRCRAFTAYKGIRASIPAIAFDDARTAVNGQIQGTCLNSTTNSAGTTVYTTLENETNAPRVSCQSNGTWSAVVGEANCKHGCDFGGWGTIRVNHGGCGDGMFYAGPAFNFKHGQQMRYGITDDCDRWCGALTTGYYCNDGNGYLNYSWAWDPNWNVCRFANYNGPTNSFSGSIDTGAFSSFYFPEGDSYTDKYGNARSFWFSVWD